MTCINQIGRIWATPIGPHSIGNFEVWIPNTSLEPMINWLTLHRRGHSCLIHPLTLEELKDHTERALWIGRSIPIKTECLKEVNTTLDLTRPKSASDSKPCIWINNDVKKMCDVITCDSLSDVMSVVH